MQAERIVGIKPLGIQKTLDITVNSNEHLFYGNGVAGSNSHSVSYAIIGYWTAYIKANYPQIFYASWLSYAKDKQKPKIELAELVQDAREFGITICNPHIDHIEPNGNPLIVGDKIYFGLCDVKNIGLSALPKVINAAHYNNSWNEFMTKGKLTNTLVNSLIRVGFFDKFGISRKYLLFLQSIWHKLGKTEQEFIARNNLDLKEGITHLINIKRGKQAEKLNGLLTLLNTPPYSIDDYDLDWIIKSEQEYMGVSLSLSRTELNAGEGDTTCKSFKSINRRQYAIVAEIDRIKYINTKKGDKMAFVSLIDHTGKLEGVIFPLAYQKVKRECYDKNLAVFIGNKTQTGSFAIEKIRQL